MHRHCLDCVVLHISEEETSNDCATWVKRVNETQLGGGEEEEEEECGHFGLCICGSEVVVSEKETVAFAYYEEEESEKQMLFAWVSEVGKERT
jgi:hypothetical protein